MSLAFANLGASAAPDINDSTDATSYASASWTPPTTGVIYVFVHSARTGGPDTPTVSGNGLTWTRIGSTLNAGAGRGLTLFAADATGATTGATTISFGTNTQLACIASFVQVTGVDLSGGVAAAVVQQVSNGSTSNATAPTLTLAAAANGANRPLACFFHVVNEASTARTNWTKADDLAGTAYNRALITEWRADAFETTASASWATGSGWGGMAVEIKAAVVDVNVAATVIQTSNLELSCTLVDNDLIFGLVSGDTPDAYGAAARPNMVGMFSRLVSFIGGFGQSDPLNAWNGSGAVPAIGSMYTLGIDRFAAVADYLGIPMDWIIWRLPWQFTVDPATGINSTISDYNSESRRLRTDKVTDYQTYIRAIGKYLIQTHGARRFKVGSEMKGFQQNTVDSTGQTWDYTLYYQFFVYTLDAIMLGADDAGVARADIAVGAPYPVLSHRGYEFNTATPPAVFSDLVNFDTRNTVTTPHDTIRYKSAVGDTSPFNLNFPGWGFPRKEGLQSSAEIFRLSANNNTNIGFYSFDFGVYNNDNIIKSTDDFYVAEQRTRDHLRWGKKMLDTIASGRYATAGFKNTMDIAEYYIKPQGTIADTNNTILNGGGAHPSGPFLPVAQQVPYCTALKAVGLSVCIEEGIRTPSWWSPFGRGDGRTAPALTGGSNADEQCFINAAIVPKGNTGAGALTAVGAMNILVNQNFAAGTPIRQATPSDPTTIYALISHTKAMLVNKTSNTTTATVQGRAETVLGPYDVQVVTWANSYTFTLGTASVTATPHALTLTFARKLTMATTVVAVTARTLTLKTARFLTMAAAPTINLTLSILGLIAARKLTLATAAYALTASAINMVKTPPLVLVLGTAQIAVTPSTLTLTAARTLTLSTVTVAVTPQALTLAYGRVLTMTTVAVTLTASAMTLAVGRVLTLASVPVAVTAQTLQLLRSYNLALVTTALTVTPQNLTMARATVLTLTTTTVDVTAQDVTLDLNRKLSLSTTSVALTVPVLNLSVIAAGHYQLTLTTILVAATLPALGLSAARKLTLDSTAVALTTNDMGLSATRTLRLLTASVRLTVPALGLIAANEPDIPLPRERTFAIERENRTYAIPHEERIFAIMHEDRTFAVEQEN